MPEALSRAAAALVELQNALADVKLAPTAAGEHHTLADIARGHLETLAHLIHAGDVLDKLHDDPHARLVTTEPLTAADIYLDVDKRPIAPSACWPDPIIRAARAGDLTP